MAEYEFTLKFSVAENLAQGVIEDKLFEAGCDDALIGVGTKGRLALAFCRESDSANQAIISAITDVKSAIPDAKLIEAEPDLVGVTDIAEMFGFTRQNMRKLLQTHVNSFPLPLHEGRAALWHLADVLEWFEAYRDQSTSPASKEIAQFTMRLNMARDFQRVPADDLKQLAASL
ncbi:hypothetical protein SAMN05216429_101151 [Marinobacter persicus]|uniref:AlpA family transcriptional regulator n=1 Tax=Marinobacter persicus TaxID=930118 RepID=A0A1I3PCH5_9GAMM|nr:DNA-binding protein [Marinobacter persicus]GHD53940.1 DNA-binding protein [Marinobacter persicus]SFJ19238.1 hypothetical protein SAMN05216429_101151 [Marinobacter persicus]